MEKVDNRIKIYTLSHPDTKEIRYIGKTKYSLNDRLAKHLLTKEENHRGKWIRKLLRENKRPIIELLEEVDNDEWIISEKYWIAQFRAWGFRLLNLSEGGETGIISPQCRAAQIKAITGVKPTKETILKRIIHTSKPVLSINISTGKTTEFPSASEASRNGFCLSHITECCNGKRKTHKGYRWKYIEDIV